jgi:hypothetical protein
MSWHICLSVVFCESMFPFSTLHPNAGAHLHSEISLLPPSLLESMPSGVSSMDNDHMPKSTCASLQPYPLHDATRVFSTMDHTVFLPGISYSLEQTDDQMALDPRATMNPSVRSCIGSPSLRPHRS